MLKDELEAIIKSDNIWAGRSTLVLALGILGEYVVLPFFDDARTTGKRPLKILFAVLVVAGIVGEYEFSSRIARSADKLQQISDQELTDATMNAGAAIERASKADERAFKNEKEAARLTKLAEDERTARVKIEAKVAWRHLTDEQQREIASELGRRFTGTQGLSLWFSTGDTESSVFGGDIAKALIAVKNFSVQPPASILTMRESGKFGDPVRPPDTGVQVQSTMHEPSRQLAAAIVKELTSRGFDARVADPPVDPDPLPKVWVNVWARPDGPQGELKLAEEKRSSAKK